jgi:hypothetical protein
MARKRYCRPLLLAEVAELIWPGRYTDRPHIGAQKARRFLRRLEKARGIELLFREKRRQYTTRSTLREYCSELFDDPDRIRREIDERWEVAQLRLVKVEQTLKKLSRKVGDELNETVEIIREIKKDVKDLQNADLEK